ncbi:MAG: hypothetical protein Q4G69_07035 [Planctomycetia bacterium]|nr:hypothetical protein [Planctomycetia bacterium]
MNKKKPGSRKNEPIQSQSDLSSPSTGKITPDLPEKEKGLSKENPSSLSLLTGAVLVFLVVFTILFNTTGKMSLTWDEGDSFRRADSIVNWFGAVRGKEFPLPDGTSKKINPFTREGLELGWEGTTRREGHPAGYSEIIAVGKIVADSLNCGISQKVSYRIGPSFLFAIALAAVYYRLTKMSDRKTGIAAVLAILLIPRLFGHVNISACESTLLGSWILSWAVFHYALRSNFGAVVWGAIMGLVLSAKFTGWLVPLPYIAWVVLYYYRKPFSKEVLRIALIGLPCALLFFFILNPPLWFNLFGVSDFVALNMDRKPLNIPATFLGQYCDIYNPLPWYNTLFWTGVTVPAGLLILALFALGSQITLSSPQKKESDSGILERKEMFKGLITLAFFHYLLLATIRMIPGVPVHDNARQIIGMFPFIGILAGIGAGKWMSWAVSSTVRKVLVYPALALFYGTAIFNMYWYSPLWLEYYNCLIGGPNGARNAGMEFVYYWDTLDKTSLDTINRLAVTPDGKPGKVLFSYHAMDTIERLKKFGELKPFARSTLQGLTVDLDEYQIYVFQPRISVLRPLEIRLMNECKPLWIRFIHSGGFGPWDTSQAPVLLIYDMKDFQRLVLEEMEAGQREDVDFGFEYSFRFRPEEVEKMKKHKEEMMKEEKQKKESLDIIKKTLQ